NRDQPSCTSLDATRPNKTPDPWPTKPDPWPTKPDPWPTKPFSTFVERVRKACLAVPSGLPETIEHLLACIELLTERLAKADVELSKLAEEHATCKLLMTIPGIGPVSSLRFVAALDRVDRFPNAHSVQAFLGLVPG